MAKKAFAAAAVPWMLQKGEGKRGRGAYSTP